MRTFLLFALVWMLGCGRKEPESATEADAGHPPAAAAERAAVKPSDDKRPVIVALGDSISAGFGVAAGQAYPEVLEKELGRQGFSYRVVNAGISGDTTSGGLSRIDSVLAQKPELVIVELGGNDGLRGLPMSATRSNLEQIIQTLQKADIRVVLAGMTLPPNYGADYIRSFEQVYKDLARKYKVTLIPFLLEGVATPEFMQKDGLHPTPEGHRRVAAIVAKTVEPLLRAAHR